MQKLTKAIAFKYGKKTNKQNQSQICCSALIHSASVFSLHFERIRQNVKWKGETGSKHGHLEKVWSDQIWAGLKIPQSCYFSELMVKISLLKLWGSVLGIKKHPRMSNRDVWLRHYLLSIACQSADYYRSNEAQNVPDEKHLCFLHLSTTCASHLNKLWKINSQEQVTGENLQCLKINHFTI